MLVVLCCTQQSLLRRARLRGLANERLNALIVLPVLSPTNVADQPPWLGEHQAASEPSSSTERIDHETHAAASQDHASMPAGDHGGSFDQCRAAHTLHCLRGSEATPVKRRYVARVASMVQGLTARLLDAVRALRTAKTSTSPVRGTRPAPPELL